jgi:hypothetical protein
MKKPLSDDFIVLDWVIGALVLLIALVIVASEGCQWYKAGVQAKVYRRQGVEMSRWEVFCGAKPVERYLKEPGHAEQD